jgi:glycosyltransferase involved in cell wall biosynthesis
MIPVSVIIPVKNEERNLGKCLSLLSDFDQILVVDSNSSDRTEEIAHKYKAEVHQFDWNGKLPKKRNWALQTLPIDNKWVLFLDADEYVTDAFCNEVQERIQNTKVDGFWVKYETYFMGKKLKYGDKLKKLSLFKKGRGEYEKIEENFWSNLDMEVHEQVIVEGSTGTVKTPIIHRDYNGLEKYIKRHNEYSTWEAKRFTRLAERELKKMSKRKLLKYRLMQFGLLPFIFFIGCYFLKLGFLDGKQGFYYATYKSYYFFQIQTKIAESKNNESISD